MLGRLVLLFLLTPAIELAVLIQVDQLIGFGPTIGLIVATGIVGSYLARREGINTWRRLNQRLAGGDLPGKELVDGAIILVAGALLVTPGILTDVVGFLGLIPLSRTLIRKALMRRFQSKMREGSMQVQFGIFGSSAPGPNGPNHNHNGHAEREAREEPADEKWQGSGRRMPRHTGTSPSSEESSPSS